MENRYNVKRSYDGTFPTSITGKHPRKNQMLFTQYEREAMRKYSETYYGKRLNEKRKLWKAQKEFNKQVIINFSELWLIKKTLELMRRLLT